MGFDNRYPIVNNSNFYYLMLIILITKALCIALGFSLHYEPVKGLILAIPYEDYL